MKNRYRNPWANETLVKRQEFYENDAAMIYEYRGVQVFKLHENHFDYVLDGCAISQRAGFPKSEDERKSIIDGYFDGSTLCCETVAAHINANGGTAISY